MSEKIKISLAAWRVNAGYTQEDVARKMDVTKQTIISWEKGKRLPGIPELNMLANIYGTSTDNIFLKTNSTKSRA